MDLGYVSGLILHWSLANRKNLQLLRFIAIKNTLPWFFIHFNSLCPDSFRELSWTGWIAPIQAEGRVKQLNNYCKRIKYFYESNLWAEYYCFSFNLDIFSKRQHSKCVYAWMYFFWRPATDFQRKSQAISGTSRNYLIFEC